MLIRFTIKNYASFLEEQSLSMIKGREVKLPEHINDDETSGFKTLRGAVIYGSNASGKSNLIEAMGYAKNFIAHNIKSDKDQTFKLNDVQNKEPNNINFEFKINNKAYSYGFESQGKEVIREWLYEIFTTRQDKMLFERSPKTGEKADIKFSPKIKKEIEREEFDDLMAAARTTPDDTLFLHDAKKRNIKLFLEPLKWFEEKLLILNPESVEPFSKQRDEFMKFLTKVLKAADVGIHRVELEKEENLLKFMPQKLADRIEETLKDGDSAFVVSDSITDKKRLLVTKKQGKLCAYRLVTIHRTKEGKDIKFELDRESDGTRRLIDLAPAFFSKNVPDRVLIIDELDRSLHPKITEMLHDAHYNDPARINGQMILATHEHYLLSQEFYRRDEIWFIEKDEFGISNLYSLSDYKIRHDKDIEKDYLLGRYGATPYVRKINA